MNLHPGQSVANLHGDLSGSLEQGYLQVPSSPGSGLFKRFTIAVPSTADLLQGDFFTFVQPGGEVVAVWFDIDATTTEPNGALYSAADVKIEVDVVTGGTAAQNAALVKTAVDGAVGVTEYADLTRDTATLTFVADVLGTAVDPATHNEAEDGDSLIVAASVNQGAAASLQNKKFTLKDEEDNAFYVWLNFNSEGVDPTGTGTGLEATVVGEATQAQVATAIATAIDAEAAFTAAVDSPGRVKVVNVDKGEVTDMADGNTGFTFAIQGQGHTKRGEMPGDSPEGNRNSPSTF